MFAAELLESRAVPDPTSLLPHNTPDLPCPPQAALGDLVRAEEVDAWDEEIPALRRRVLAAQRAAEQQVDKQLAARMLGR